MAEDEVQGLFDTTRGKLLLLLCRGPHTVNELMDELGVTDNAVRAQLASLQLSGLVRTFGLRPGTRKPHVDYELTPRARRLFPQAHKQVLDVLVGVLRERLPPEQVAGLLKETARKLVGGWAGQLDAPEPRDRITQLFRRLRGLDVGVSMEESSRGPVLRACGCPLASVTSQYPEVCGLLAEVLGELVGTTVRERCDRDDSPRCCFEVNPGEQA